MSHCWLFLQPSMHLPQHVYSLITSSANLAPPVRSLVIETPGLHHYSGKHYSNALTANSICLLHFTHKPMGSLSDLIAPLSRSFVPMCHLSRMTGTSFCHKCVLHLIHWCMQVHVFPHFSAYLALHQHFLSIMHCLHCKTLKCNLLAT